MQKSDAAAELQKLMSVGKGIKYESEDEEEENEEDSIVVLESPAPKLTKEKPICKPKVENGTLEQPIVNEKRRQRDVQTKKTQPQAKRQRKSEDSKNEEKKKKKRRWRPGTVAIRHVKRYQSTVCPFVPYKLMERTIRRHTNKYYYDIKLASGCVEIIREIIEDEIIKATECCQLARLNCNQQITLTQQDLQLYKAIRFKNIL
jgi:histone H3